MEKKTHLSWYISGEVTVGSKLEVAAISCPVVHHIYLPWLEWDKGKKQNVEDLKDKPCRMILNDIYVIYWWC